MSGIVGSRLNNRGSGLIGSLGTDGQVLTSSGAGAGAVFEASSGFDVSSITGATALGATPADTDEFVLSDAGVLKRVDYSYIKAGLDYLGTTTISSGVSTVDITLDTTNYGSFKFMLNAVLTETDTDVLNMRYSTDSGSSFADGASDYGYASWEQRTGAAHSTDFDNDTDTFPMNQGETNIGTPADESTSHEITLWNNQPYPKVSCIGGANNSSANFTQWHRTAIFMTTSTVNAVRFYWSTGGFNGGTIDKYGFTK